jgi:hypothetical protein
LTAVFYFFFALRAFRSRVVATLTGLLCALNPFWIVNTAQIDDGVLATFLLAACIALGARAGQTGGPISGFLYGVGLAALNLVRAALLPFGIVALLWLLIRCRRVPRGWLCALLAFLGFANGLALWTFRNYQLFHDIVPIADSAFYHAWIGNNPRADGGPLSEEIALEALAESRGQDVATASNQLAELSQKDRYLQLSRDVLRETQANPAGAINHRLESAITFFLGQEWLKNRAMWQQNTGDQPALPGWLDNAYPAIFLGTAIGMLGLAILGWRWSYGWRSTSLPASLAAIWIPLPYILSHAEALSGPRLPLDGVLLCYAAFAIGCLLSPSAPTLLRGSVVRSEQQDRAHP